MVAPSFSRPMMNSAEPVSCRNTASASASLAISGVMGTNAFSGDAASLACAKAVVPAKFWTCITPAPTKITAGAGAGRDGAGQPRRRRETRGRRWTEPPHLGG